MHLLLVLAAASCAEAPDPPADSPNILIVLLDDVGQDGVAAYEASPRPPTTPTLDRLADEGVRFTRAYAYPSCRPSRGAMLTGRYVRTGIFDSRWRLRRGTRTFAEIAQDAGYETAAFGKWHLAGPRTGQLRHPERHGFDYFAGRMGNFVDTAKNWEGKLDYYRWEFVRDGDVSLSTDWGPTVVIDEATAWLDERDGPWLAYVALSAAHGPMHVPPSELQSTDVARASEPWQKFRAIVEAADTELGRLLAAIDPDVLSNTVVLVAGDNGTDDERDAPGIGVLGGKTSLYDGGTRVPLIVTGPPVTSPGAVHDGLVHLVDVLPTVADLVWADAGEVDGRSLLPFVEEPSREDGRTELFNEMRGPVVDRRVMMSKTLKLGVNPRQRKEWVTRLGPLPSDEARVDSADLDEAERRELERLRRALNRQTRE